MIYQILDALDHAKKLPQAHAHCDIPCKIYDPVSAQLAALSVVRLIDIMTEASAAEPEALQTQNTIASCVMRKEEEAERVKGRVVSAEERLETLGDAPRRNGGLLFLNRISTIKK